MQAVAPQRRHRRHGGSACGDDVALVVTHVHAVFGGNANGLRSVQQRQRVRLAFGQAVTADQHRTALLPAMLRQDQARQVLGFVGDDAPHRTGLIQRGEHAGHAVEQHCVLADQRFIALQEFRDQCIARSGIQVRERGRDHRPRALRHHRAQCGRIDGCTTTFGQHRVAGGDEVRRAVQQRAIQVEQHRRREAGGGHAGLTA